ncbi:hypothetical protein ABZ923_34525 [Streptomyces sp. NPDC046881]|uniref:hypothetical protein n=1 Tax=Streptomyces sp. NPDC046881 TaxID=3155374 RepID=UPI0033C5E6F5
MGFGFKHALYRPVEELDNPPEDVKYACGQRTAEWVRSIAIPNEAHVSFVLTSERDESVVVLGLTPHVRKLPDTAMNATVSTCTGGNGIVTRHADLVVDSTEQPTFRFTDERGRKVERLRLNLSKGGAVDFHVTSRAESPGVYEWTADLELLVGGEPKSISITNEGKPFKISGPVRGKPEINMVDRLPDDNGYCLSHPDGRSC